MKPPEEKLRSIRECYHRAVIAQLRIALESLQSELQSTALLSSVDTHTASNEQVEWVQISSLSQLRSMVGGRFENLKRRWEQAGFPLRAHRGEELGEFTIQEDGWLELSSWLYKQGFENRLEDSVQGVAFSIRPLGGP